jgi:hypothetical protein
MFSYLRRWFAKQPRRVTATISVTWDDIRDARPEDCTACPIALAAKRVIPADVIHVMPHYIRMWFGKTVITRELPPVASTFVNRYDWGLVCYPIVFDISYLNNGE